MGFRRTRFVSCAFATMQLKSSNIPVSIAGLNGRDRKGRLVIEEVRIFGGNV